MSKAIDIRIREVNEAGHETRLATRWAIHRGSGVNAWSVADALGRDSRGYAFEAGARKDLANWLRKQADLVEKETP